MPSSTAFQHLQERLERLEKRFLKKRLDTGGQDSDELKDFARCYRFLAHAEIEAFVRTRVEEIVQHALYQWCERRVAHPVVVSVLAWWNKDWTDDKPNDVPVPNKEKKDTGTLTVDALVKRAFRAFQARIENLYGLRPADLNAFLRPLGIVPNDLGSTWLADMDNFGMRRGTVAHRGEAASNDINPSDERQRIKAILPGIEKIDKWFDALLNQPSIINQDAGSEGP